MATKHHTAAHSLSLSGMGQRIRKVKVRKLVGWDKDSLIDKAKAKQHKQSKRRNSFITSHQQAGVQPSPGKQGTITHNSYLGRQMPSLWTSPPSFFFPPLYMLSMTSYGMEYPSGQLGSAVPAVSPPNSLCTPSVLAGGAVSEAEETLTLCKHCSAITKTSMYYQHCLQHKSKP